MAEKLWKTVERRIGEILGGDRVPITGRGDLPDVIAGALSVEVKVRTRSIPKWMRKAVRQAAEGAVAVLEEYGYRMFPVVVLHLKGREYLDDYVLIRLEDFAELLNGRTWDSDNGEWVSADGSEASIRGSTFQWDRDRGVGTWSNDTP